MSWDKTKFKTYDTSEGFGNAREWKKAFYERVMPEAEAEEILNGQDETPYSILGISAGATQAQIKAAFYLMIKKWHPDNNSHRILEATEMSKKIIAAYTILKR